MNAVTGLKMVVCGAIAAAVTWMGSWSFVTSTAMVHQAVQPMQVAAGAVLKTATHIGRVAVTGLVQ